MMFYHCTSKDHWTLEVVGKDCSWDFFVLSAMSRVLLI